jgi:hypothetical protein
LPDVARYAHAGGIPNYIFEYSREIIFMELASASLVDQSQLRAMQNQKERIERISAIVRFNYRDPYF